MGQAARAHLIEFGFFIHCRAWVEAFFLVVWRFGQSFVRVNFRVLSFWSFGVLEQKSFFNR